MEVYFDNSLIIKLYIVVIDEVVFGFKEFYGNFFLLYNLGLKSEKKLRECREVIGKIINVEENEIYFNVGGSEGNNLVFKGILKLGSYFIIILFEYVFILNIIKGLEISGVKVIFLRLDKNGKVDLEYLKNFIIKEIVLVLIMYVNNEIGII